MKKQIQGGRKSGQLAGQAVLCVLCGTQPDSNKVARATTHQEALSTILGKQIQFPNHSRFCEKCVYRIKKHAQVQTELNAEKLAWGAACNTNGSAHPQLSETKAVTPAAPKAPLVTSIMDVLRGVQAEASPSLEEKKAWEYVKAQVQQSADAFDKRLNHLRTHVLLAASCNPRSIALT